jgi:hypothetical protein
MVFFIPTLTIEEKFIYLLLTLFFISYVRMKIDTDI